MLMRAATVGQQLGNSCASLAGLVLSFIACFILLVIAPLKSPKRTHRPRNSVGGEFQTVGPAAEKARRSNVIRGQRRTVYLYRYTIFDSVQRNITNV